VDQPHLPIVPDSLGDEPEDDRPWNRTSIIAFACAFGGLVTLGITSIAAVPIGALSLRQIRASSIDGRATQKGRDLAWAGIGLGIGITATIAFAITVTLANNQG
jgi:hypothetical protein